MEDRRVKQNTQIIPQVKFEPSPLSPLPSSLRKWLRHLQSVVLWSCGLVVLFTTFCLFLVSCSPSLDEAKQVLQQQISSQSQGHIKLVSFRKTDLQEFQVAGVPGRRISYAAQIEFQENGLWSRGVGNKSLNFEFTPNPRTAEGDSTPNPYNTEEIAAQMIKDLQGQRQMSKGDRTKIVGVMAGTRSEHGWKYELGESRTTD